MNFVTHRFGPSETIESIIYLKNKHNASKDEIASLMVFFNAFNRGQLPHVGSEFKIPVLDRNLDQEDL